MAHAPLSAGERRDRCCDAAGHDRHTAAPAAVGDRDRSARTPPHALTRLSPPGLGTRASDSGAAAHLAGGPRQRRGDVA
ncbi:hypothetical protein ABE10_00040, partial [Bacillus toyonensis]|nr:hypothetical protein [Bacillus toyonensis]